MQNLEQIRAKNALAISDKLGGQEGGDIVNKVPTMIRNNGIIAACAFAMEKGKPKEGKDANGYAKLLDHLRAHLATPEIGAFCPAHGEELVRHLAGRDSATLRAATAESLAFLNHVRRFYKARHKDEE